jgi:transcriptional regulator with GAF, ATPase, and Fis domain
MKPLLDFASALAHFTELDPLLDAVVGGLVESAGAEKSFLALVERGRLNVRAARCSTGGRVAHTVCRTLLEKSMREDRPILRSDALEDPSLSTSRSLLRHRVRAVCAVPLKAAGGLIGAVSVHHREPGVFDASAVAALQAFAGVAALAIRHAQVAGSRPAPIPPPPPALLIGASPAMTDVRTRLDRIAPSPYPVHLLGESGTGKELAARFLHSAGPRAAGPFVAANCGAIPASLAEAEFFGHTKGAFTGADADRPGLFQQAHGGTLFLDEVEAMPPAQQDLLLRVVQDGVVRPVGSRETRQVDVRLVTASNVDLRTLAAAGRFRSDLWYRLNVLRVELPRLRDRADDIPTLAGHLLRRIAAETGDPVKSLSAGALRTLASHDWPGNVRQLENMLRQAAALVDGDVIDSVDLEEPRPAPPSAGELPLMGVDDFIRHHIVRHEPDLGLTRLAEILGLSRTTLWKKRRQFGLA